MMWHLATAFAAGFYGVLAGLLVPEIIRRVPEPEAEPGDSHGSHAGSEAGQGPAGEAPPREAKEPYADIARLRGLRTGAALATGAVAAALGARVGWRPELSFLLYLAPVGVALAVIDWRTRLLPTRLIAPSYGVVAVLAVLSAWADRDWHALETAGWGWLVSGGTFLLLWLVYPRGMGYGDVRLSGVLGIALGYLGWAPMLSGVYAGFLLGGFGGLLLSLLRVVDRKAYPFGPFMLLGALAGVLLGPYVAAWYG
jgi:leader peptidase (prepilin peptidase)/N-methyltransferase